MRWTRRIRIIMGRGSIGWWQFNMYRLFTFGFPFFSLTVMLQVNLRLGEANKFSWPFSPPDWEMTCCPLDTGDFLVWDGPTFLQLLPAGSWVWLFWCSEIFTEEALSTRSGIQGSHGSFLRDYLRWELDSSYTNFSHTQSFFFNSAKINIMENMKKNDNKLT